MSFLKRIFGGGKPSRPMRDVAELAKPLAVPALHVVATESASLSHFGGIPSLPKDAAWPQHEGTKLQFLARLSLTELHAVHAFDWLPRSGALLFFYDPEQRAWGFDPKDRGSWAVLHVPDLPQPVTASAAFDASEDALPHRPAQFRRIESYPSSDRESVKALELDDHELDAFGELSRAPFRERPEHQVGGFPNPVQSDTMELESQLASSGIYVGDEKGYKDPRVESLMPGAAEWRLLLQFDTDDDLGVMWGDAGLLYFWIQESAARAGKFENTWMVLQCT